MKNLLTTSRFRGLTRRGLSYSCALITPLIAGSLALAQYHVVDTGVYPEGQFTYADGYIHSWTADSGYSIYDVSTGETSDIGLPPNGTRTNGYGDAFGVYDSTNGLFYAATVYGMSDSDVYVYDTNAGEWQTPGVSGVSMINAYGGQVHNSQLYVSGLAQPWNGGYGQDNYIFAFDHLATPGGDPARHDTLIETAGNSAYLAVAPNGDFYYATYSTSMLYRWSAEQVASVTDDLYEPGAVDNFLTLGDADDAWAVPGGGNGLAVDDAGNIFFAVNGSEHILAMLDPETGEYITILSSTDFMDWYGAMSIEGDFMAGDPLYFSSGFGGSIWGISLVPEPSVYAHTLGTLVLLFALYHRRRKSA